MVQQMVFSLCPFFTQWFPKLTQYTVVWPGAIFLRQPCFQIWLVVYSKGNHRSRPLNFYLVPRDKSKMEELGTTNSFLPLAKHAVIVVNSPLSWSCLFSENPGASTTPFKGLLMFSINLWWLWDRTSHSCKAWVEKINDKFCCQANVLSVRPSPFRSKRRLLNLLRR